MSAALGWLILAVLVIGYVVLFDVHAHFAHTPTLSHQIHDWLVNPRIAPFVFGGWIGLGTGALFHFFQYRGK